MIVASLFKKSVSRSARGPAQGRVIMYGLLLKNLQDFIVATYGAKKWQEVKDALKVHTVIIKCN